MRGCPAAWRSWTVRGLPFSGGRVALNSLAPTQDVRTEHRPDALDGATQLIQAVLVDPLVNDVHTLATINEMLKDDSEAKVRAHERRTDRQRVPYMLIAPEDPLEIGRVATDVYRDHFKSPLGFLRSPNVSGLGHLVNAARSATHGELLPSTPQAPPTSGSSSIDRALPYSLVC
jgi:hypothetical protein